MRFIMSLGKASCMLYTESPLLLPKGSKICSNLLGLQCLGKQMWRSGHEVCSVMRLRSDFHPWREKRLAIFPCDMNQADCTNSTTRLPHPVTQSALLSSASCLTEAEPCAPHSSASWVSVSSERQSQKGLWWKSGGPRTTDQIPGVGARSVGSIRTSHLWRSFPPRILCESEDPGSCGWVLPIPYFSFEQSSCGWCRWHWGLGWDPCQYSESRVSCGSQVLLLALILIFTLPRG